MNYSKYQENIFNFIEKETGHAFVEAVAGSGKTTTIVEAANRVPENSKTIFLAFNKHIATELGSKLPMNCEARTLHSLGLQVLRESSIFPKRFRVKGNKTDNIFKYNILDGDEDLIKKHYSMLYDLKRVVSMLKNLLVIEPTTGDIIEICDKFDIDRDDDEFYDYTIETFNESVSTYNTIDFDDMLFLPLLLELNFPKYDHIFVDEAQDLNPVQMEIIRQLKGRVIAVGDTHQAIYGFRGADPFAVATMINIFKATKLPLSICYRCGKNIVSKAKEIVPHIETFDGQEDGECLEIPYFQLTETVKEKDYVLCRVTAPLVSLCLEFLKKGIPATVRGRDIGEGLVIFIKRIKKEGDLEDFYEDLNEYAVKKIAQYKKRGRNSSIIELQDKVDTLFALGQNLETVEQLIERVEKLFTDTENGITLATIHRSKGLEADNIFILKPDLLPHPKAKLPWQKTQEMNLKYVAITRAKKRLYIVK